MPKYVKAYCLRQMRAFSGWNEDALDAPDVASGDGEDIVYLHESLIVTKSCLEDETVIFDRVTPEWSEFCRSVLKFQIPDWEAEAKIVREKLGL